MYPLPLFSAPVLALAGALPSCFLLTLLVPFLKFENFLLFSLDNDSTRASLFFDSEIENLFNRMASSVSAMLRSMALVIVGGLDVVTMLMIWGANPQIKRSMRLNSGSTIYGTTRDKSWNLCTYSTIFGPSILRCQNSVSSICISACEQYFFLMGSFSSFHVRAYTTASPRFWT
ncbi:hypothetical protein HanRHA438_Chr02g0088731 [Helianthus annuus]|nr:hypothetical protein HanIR_Chr02g0090291 [Helianthus annuus]KAJ0940910.1 hypothetical protein HanRHA438_Chr02g0088731 [Helianthus annuus]